MRKVVRPEINHLITRTTGPQKIGARFVKDMNYTRIAPRRRFGAQQSKSINDC